VCRRAGCSVACIPCGPKVVPNPLPWTSCPEASSVWTLGGKVAGGRRGRLLVGGSLSKPLALYDVAFREASGMG
jgi:hypothetical protein